MTNTLIEEAITS